MSNFQIHELNSVPVNRNSNIIHDTEVSSDEWDTGKDTAGAVADLALEVVASEYDDTASYAIGSYCIYGGVLYRCTTATTGAFDVSDWTAVLITGEYKRVRVMHKADFDLLTPEEQADGMIYVDDVDITASDISYDNTVSGLSADDLQEAVDEVALGIKSETGTVTPSSITTIVQSSIKRFGNLICFTMDFKVSSNSSWSKVCDITSDFKPPINSYFVGVNTGSSSGTQIATFQLSNTGSLNIANAKPDTNVQYSLCAIWLV